MIVRVHGFAWLIYVQQVMPALRYWLLDKDEYSIYQLYQQTRCAQDEQCLPPPLQALCTWSRAQSFVQQLPRNAHARSEYAHLCSPERFTAMSDRYIYRHPPQLIPPSEALRTLWGALIETYCLPWLHYSSPKVPATQESAPIGTNQLDQELLQLLQAAETHNPIEESHEHEPDPSLPDQEGDILSRDEVTASEPTGVFIGRLPTTLHIRGWLATISIRAMALFELLACERRSMPFGYQPGAPFASYAGYLTPDEVQQLALCLRDVQPPNQALAVMDYQRFRQQTCDNYNFRMIDEVLPLYADAFVTTVHLAARQGIGLICSIG
jgi:hypothetical protein